MSTDIFERASRKRLRFASAIGPLTTEDLWTLPLKDSRKVCLNELAKEVNKSLQENEVDFVQEIMTVNEAITNEQAKTDQLRLDILKHIIEYRIKQSDKVKKASETRAKKERILNIISDKQDEELKGKSLDELKEILNSM